MYGLRVKEADFDRIRWNLASVQVKSFLHDEPIVTDADVTLFQRLSFRGINGMGRTRL